MSQPEVFIIESLRFNDERQELFEGKLISDILSFRGKRCQYCYIRTHRELIELLSQFKTSSYRYLHLSCHGNDNSIATTLDSIPFVDLGKLIKPYLNKRRLFVSACSATNRKLAEEVMSGSGCYSILGPDEDIEFGDAVVLWSSFYHTMFKFDSEAMKYSVLKAKAQEVSDMFRVRLKLISQDQDSPNGYRMKSITPRKEA